MKKILLFLSFLLMSIGMFGQASTHTSNVTLDNGSNCSTCSVTIGGTNYSGKKLGASNKTGSTSFSVPAGVTTVYIHVARWNGDNGNLNITRSSGTVSPSSIKNLTSDANVSGGGSTFNLANQGYATTNYFYTLTLSSIGSATTITLTTSSKRAIIWGVNTASVPTPSYTITAQSNNESYGTVSLSGSVITGSVESCCQYASPAYSVTSGMATVSQNGNEFTVTPSSNCTVQINFEAKPKYTISFNNATGTSPSSIQQSMCGESITLPTNAQISDACSEMGWTFAGWTTKSSGGLSSSDLVGSSFTPTKDTTLYAVFKKIEGGSGESAYVIFQAPGGCDSSTERTSDSDIKSEVVDEYDGISTFSGSRLYDGGSGAKIGSSKGIGYITMNLSSPITTNQITVEASQYGSDGGDLHVEVNGDTNFGSDIAPSTGTCVFTNTTNVEISSVTITTTSGRAYLQSVTIGEGGSTEYSFNPVCETVDVDSVKLPVDTITIYVGDTYELTPTIYPANATNKNVTWLATMPSIATVENGIVTGVAEGTTGVMVVTKDGNKHAQCVVIVLGEPNIEVVEWNPDWLKIDIDNFTAATATLEDQNTQAEVKENIATELFFSKYFEAQGAIKLLGIYNGTKDSINLSNYKVKVAQGDKSTSWNKTFELGALGYIHSNEEIILISYTKNDSSITKCILGKNPQGLNYQRVASGELIGGELQFNGDDAVGLFKNTSLIDIIGAGTSSSANVSNLTTTNASGSNPKTMYGHIIDMDCWITNKADGSNGNDTTIATNLCLLIRKSTVHSGDTAVKYNTTDFITLSTEWIGKQVQKDTSSTCDNFDYVGTYDYSEHYIGFDTIYTDIPIPGKADDGFYRIDIPELDTLSCTNLKLSVKDTSNATLEKVVKIPIMIKTNATTTDATYFDKKECDKCDVVVLKDKKLTVAGTSSSNRDVKLYGGAHLSVPTGTTYTINSLTLRRENDTVSTLGLIGTLSTSKLYFDLFIDCNKWYWVALPDAMSISNIKFTNGKRPVYERDYWVRWYDGKHRAETQSGSWKGAPEDTTFQAGAGFLIGLTDDLNKKEFRFEINGALSNEKSNKTVSDLHAWGGDKDDDVLRPNHKGWNMIGNPFLNNIETDLASPIRSGYLYKNETSGSWNGEWLLSDTATSKLRYAVIPSTADEDRAAGGYKSVVLDDIKLEPFTCFFVQIGGTSPNDNQGIVFNTDDRNKYNAAPRKMYLDTNEDDELFLRVKVDNWKTGCFISHRFSDKYEPGDDLESRYPIYQTIGGYKLLYSAINDSIIEHGIPINTPSGKLYLDPKVDVTKFEYIYANYNNEWYDLMNNETVDVSGGFILQAKRKTHTDTPTSIETLILNKNEKFIYNGNLYIKKNNHIFSVLGELIQ